MTRRQFEATGTPLLHGTNRAFETFGAEAKSANQPRTTGHFFTDKPEVAHTFAFHGGGPEAINTETVHNARMRGDNVGSLHEILPHEGEELTVKHLRAAAKQRISEGRRVYFLDYDGHWVPLTDSRKLPKDYDPESGLLVYRRGREPRVIETQVYGPTMDLREAAGWPADLVGRLRDSKNTGDHALFEAYEEARGRQARGGQGRVYGIWHAVPTSPALHEYAAEHGIGKIHITDAWESGHESYYVPDLRYVGHNRDAHREFVEQALKEGKPVPARVLREYPDLAAGAAGAAGTAGGAAPREVTPETAPESKPAPQFQPDLPPGHDYIEPQIGSPVLNYGERVTIVNGGPVDGYITRIVKPGVRTVDEVIRPAEVETQPDRPAPKGFHAGIYRPFASTAKPKPAPIPSGSPEFDRWYQESTGAAPQPPAFRERLHDWVTTRAAYWTRPYPHMPRDDYHEPLKVALDHFRQAPQLARMKAVIRMGDAVGTLDPAEYDLLGRWLVWQNLSENEAKGIPNPPDVEALGPGGLAQVGTGLTAELAKRPAVQQAAVAWRRNVDRISQEYLDSIAALGLKTPEFTKEDWFHQEFLAPAAERLAQMRVGRTPLKAVPRLDVTMRREGGVDFRTDPIEAHFQALTDMVFAAEKNKLLRLLQTAEEQGGYNAMPRVKAQQTFGKDKEARQWLADLEGQGGAPVIVRAMPDRVGQMAAAGILPDDGNGKYAHVIDALAQHWALNEAAKATGGAPVGIDPSVLGDLREYARFVRELFTKPAGGGKAPGELLPEGYTPYRIVDGHPLFRAQALPAKLADDLVNGVVQQLGVTSKDLRPVLALGRAPDQMLLKESVARTIHTLTPPEVSPVDADLRRLMQGAKLLAVVNWEHTPTLLKEHLTGSMFQIAQANPGIMKQFPQAIADMWNARAGLTGRKAMQTPTESYQGFLLQGAGRDFRTTLGTAGEEEAFNRLAQFAADNRGTPEKVFQLARRLVMVGRIPVNRLDELFRYATYLDALADIRKNGGPTRYLSARPDLAEAVGKVNGPEALAYYLSDQLMGPYNDMPAMLQSLRDKFPSAYWGFLFGKAKSQYGIMANNIWRNPAIQRQMAARLGAGRGWEQGRRARAGAGRAGSFSVATEGAFRYLFPFLLLSGALAANNRLRFGKQEEEMGHQPPHLDLGKFPDGRMLVWDRVGSLPGPASLLHLDDPFGVTKDLLNGNMTPKEAWKEFHQDGKAALISLAAQQKVPVELLSGTRMGGGPIRDYGEWAADRLHVGQFYRGVIERGLLRQPVPGAPARERRIATLLGARLEDPAEDAFYQAVRNAKAWMIDQQGISQDAKQDAEWTPLQAALLGYRKSLQYGDTQSAMLYVAAIAKARMAQVLSQPRLSQEGAKAYDAPVQKALLKMEPLYGMPDGQIPRYLKTLTPREKVQLRTAYSYWRQVTAPHAPVPKTADLRQFILDIRPGVQAAIATTLPVSEWIMGHPAAAQGVQDQVLQQAEQSQRWKLGEDPRPTAPAGAR